MKKIILIILLSFLIFITGINCVNAENLVTLDNIKIELEKSEVMKKYNAKMMIETSTLFIDTDNIIISFNYSYGNLIYAMDSNVAFYGIDQSVMTADEFMAKSKESMEIVSEVVACVADLYGYAGYHGDWIGNMFFSDYVNNGIYYNMDNINNMATLYDLKLDLNGKFESYLNKLELSSAQNNSQTTTNNAVVTSPENSNQIIENNTEEINNNVLENNTEEKNNQNLENNIQEKNDNDDNKQLGDNKETIIDRDYYLFFAVLALVIVFLYFHHKNLL